jgi:hypothetical protein
VLVHNVGFVGVVLGAGKALKQNTYFVHEDRLGNMLDIMLQ